MFAKNTVKLEEFKNVVYKNIDSVRFLFSIIIVYFHILHRNIFKSLNEVQMPNYEALALSCSHTYLIVECFFIIAGFFLFKTFVCKKDLSFKDFVVDKIARLWPVLAFYLLLEGFGYRQFLNLFFLQSIGISLESQGINWYISPFFWVLIFYFYLLKNFSLKAVNLVIALCVYFGFVININYLSGSFGRNVIFDFLNLGMLRALAGIGIGYFIGNFYMSKKDKIEKLNSKLSYILFSVFEVLTFGFLIYHFLFSPLQYKNHFIFVIVFSIFFILLLFKKGVVSNVLDKLPIYKLGKYSYSIYVMQQLSFYWLRKSLWKYSSLLDNVGLTITLSLLFSFIVGVLTYYLIEKPGRKLIYKILR